MSKAHDRDALLEQALLYTAQMSGRARDRAIYDFLVGAVTGLHLADLGDPVPPWLWVLGVRGGTRLKEIQKMLDASREGQP